MVISVEYILFCRNEADPLPESWWRGWDRRRKKEKEKMMTKMKKKMKMMMKMKTMMPEKKKNELSYRCHVVPDPTCRGPPRKGVT